MIYGYLQMSLSYFLPFLILLPLIFYSQESIGKNNYSEIFLDKIAIMDSKELYFEEMDVNELKKIMCQIEAMNMYNGCIYNATIAEACRSSIIKRAKMMKVADYAKKRIVTHEYYTFSLAISKLIVRCTSYFAKASEENSNNTTSDDEQVKKAKAFLSELELDRKELEFSINYIATSSISFVNLSALEYYCLKNHSLVKDQYDEQIYHTCVYKLDQMRLTFSCDIERARLRMHFDSNRNYTFNDYIEKMVDFSINESINSTNCIINDAKKLKLNFSKT